MNKQMQTSQPIAYQILSNALNKQRLAHAYLFVGPKDAQKKEWAYLLAQSLVCEQTGFACGVCDTCLRIQHNNYADMRYLDSTTTSIKKEDIIELKEEFSKTNVERKGKKIYILDGAENATPSALQALLTFLEEPNTDVVAILLIENLDRMLETIQSRCQIIPFKGIDRELQYEQLKMQYPKLDAYLLSQIAPEIDKIENIHESEEFQHAVFIFTNYVNKRLLQTCDIQVFIQNDGFKKSKMNARLVLQYFMKMLYIFAKDCIIKKDVEDVWYQSKIKQCNLEDAKKLLEISSEITDRNTKSVNVSLLVDEFLYKMGGF